MGGKARCVSMNEKVILCVEDNINVQAFNKPQFEERGYTVKLAMTLAEAREVLMIETPGLVILDINMPDGNGFEFLRELRSSDLKYSDVPVLILTGYGKDEDIVTGFENGCNDYLAKPYTFPVLFLRVRELFSRVKHTETITKGNLQLNMTSMAAYLCGEDLLLQPKEFSLLALFIKHEGDTIKARHLYEQIWRQNMGVDTSPVKNAISRLRKKLVGSGYTITAKRGEGYYFERE